MPITFPLTGLMGSVLTKKFELIPRQSYSRTGGGTAIAYDFGVAIWRGMYETARLSHDDCIAFQAVLHALEGAAGTTYGYDTRRPYPRAYQNGVFTDSGLIRALDADGKSMSFKSLPVGFSISVGDYFHVDKGGKRYFHQIIEAVTADGSGNTTKVTCEPHYDPVLAVNDPVTFKTPGATMRLEPGSLDYADQGSALGTVSFNLIQA